MNQIRFARLRPEVSMVRSLVLSVILVSSTGSESSFHAATQSDASAPKKVETSTLVVRAEDKKTAKVVMGARVIVRWGDFADESKSKENPTLESGLATFSKLPRERIKIQV